VQLLTKVLIAGGSGFIGNNLSEYLKSANFITTSLSLREDGWENKMASDWDVVINLIGKAHDHSGRATEKEYFAVNYNLTKLIFSEFLKSSAKIFIHISTIAAVEEFDSIELINEDHKQNPISFYGLSKFKAEEWLLSQPLNNSKKLVILRPPMVHGKGDKGNLGLLFKFISKGIPYPLSAFDNSRSFIYIENFNFLISQIIRYSDNLQHKLYHISDDEPVPTSRVIEIISKVIGRKISKIKFPKFIINILASIGDVIPFPLNRKRLRKLTGNLIVSNKKIKDDLGIKNLPYTAEQGIEATIRSFLKHKSY